MKPRNHSPNLKIATFATLTIVVTILLPSTASACVPGSFSIPLGPDASTAAPNVKRTPDAGVPLAMLGITLAVLLSLRGRTGGPRSLAVFLTFLLPLLLAHPPAIAQGQLGPGLYLDLDASARTSNNDLRLLSNAGYIGGSLVRAGDSDASLSLVAHSPHFLGVRYIDDNGNGAMDATEGTYLSSSSSQLASGDVRLVTAGGITGGTVVKNGDTDVGRTSASAGSAKYTYYDANGNAQFESSDTIVLHFGSGAVAGSVDIVLSGSQAFRRVGTGSPLNHQLVTANMPNVGDEKSWSETTTSSTPTTTTTTSTSPTTPSSHSSSSSATPTGDGSRSPRVLASLFVQTDAVATGTNVAVRTWTRNLGEAKADSATLTLTIDGIQRQQSSYTDVANRSSTPTQEFLASFRGTGWHDIKAATHYSWTDAAGRAQQGDEETTSKVYSYEASNPTLPNLVVSSASLKSAAADGLAHVVAKVRNAGRLGSRATTVLFSFPGFTEYDASADLPLLDIGAEAEVVGPSVGTEIAGHSVHVQADPVERVHETSETDNAFDLPVPVAKVLVNVPALWASKATHIPKEPVRAFARIANAGETTLTGLKAHLVVGGQTLADHVVPDLEAGQTFVVFDDAAPAAGALEVSVNVKDAASKDLAVAKLALPQADVVAHVKLVELCAHEVGTRGDVSLVALVANSGASESRGGSMAFSVDGVSFGSPPVPALGPFDEITIESLPWRVTGSVHALAVTATADGGTIATLATTFDARLFVRSAATGATLPTFPEAPL